MIASVTPVMTYVSDEQYPFSGGHFEERPGETALSSGLEFIILYFVFPYIAVTILVLTLEQYRKFLGVDLIVLALYTLFITFFISRTLIGILVCALLLSAGILAIRFKPKLKDSHN